MCVWVCCLLKFHVISLFYWLDSFNSYSNFFLVFLILKFNLNKNFGKSVRALVLWTMSNFRELITWKTVIIQMYVLKKWSFYHSWVSSDEITCTFHIILKNLSFYCITQYFFLFLLCLGLLACIDKTCCAFHIYIHTSEWRR